MDGRTRLRRLWRHLVTDEADARRLFPPALRDEITAAVSAGERLHAAELRVVFEAALPLREVLAGVSPRQRALDWFARLHVWDTEENVGVLVYVLLADRAVELVADRGVARAVTQADWDAIVADQAAGYHVGRWGDATLVALHRIARVLAGVRPAGPADVDELPDAPEWR